MGINRNFNIPPPRGIPRTFDPSACPGGRAFEIHLYEVGNLIASLDFMLRAALIPRGLINHGGDGGSRLWWIERKRLRIRGELVENQRPTRAVFHIWGGWFISITCMCCLINHVNMQSFRSIVEATEKQNSTLVIFPGVGHLNSFSARWGGGEGGVEQKFSKNSNARGVCLSFNLIGT